MTEKKAEASARRFSLAGKLFFVVAASVLAAAVAAFLAAWGRLPPALLLVSSLAAGLSTGAALIAQFWTPMGQTLEALADGIASFRDGDFGLRVAATRDDEMGDLVGLFNRMGDALRNERSALYQRELLLDTLLKGAPMAIVLADDRGRVTYSNTAARRLVGEGRRLEGKSLGDVLGGAPAELRDAVAAGEDALVTVAGAASGPETYRVAVRDFLLDTRRQRLHVVERITPELRRQEVEIWKRVLRVLSHELNNSLAPVSSLVHSARQVATMPEKAGQQDAILASVEERVKHLSAFLEGYARFARLPQPRKEEVSFATLLDAVKPLYGFHLAGPLPEAPGCFDLAQMQQVLINLLKNAHESGSPPEQVSVFVEERPQGGFLLHVLDRGEGMPEEAMRTALLPFHSAKPGGSGLGLALANEILAAHGGRLVLRRRERGGTAVTCVLPAQGSASSSSTNARSRPSA